MNYLLDTVTISDLYETSSPGHSGIARRLAKLGKDDVLFISVLSLYELEYGFANAPPEKKQEIRRRITDAQSSFRILSLSAQAAGMFGFLKKRLRDARNLTERGSRYHNIDVMLAATAIAESCTLVSADSLFKDLQEFDARLMRDHWDHS
jgi:predicted nucleic acid-binding protein